LLILLIFVTFCYQLSQCNNLSSSSRTMVVPTMSAASLRMALISPEARQTSRGSPVQGRSCMGDRETLGRAACREGQRQEAAPEELRTMDLSWRSVSISQLQRAYAGDLSGSSSTIGPQRPATSSTSRSSPIAELLCDPPYRGHYPLPPAQVRGVHPADNEPCSAESKTHFEQQPTIFAASSARFEQQQTSNRVNDEQCLRLRQWTKTEITCLVHHHHRLRWGQRFIVIKQSSGPLDSGSGDISSMYAQFHVRGNQRVHG